LLQIYKFLAKLMQQNVTFYVFTFLLSYFFITFVPKL
jgi:hypothetical protein